MKRKEINIESCFACHFKHVSDSVADFCVFINDLLMKIGIHAYQRPNHPCKREDLKSGDLAFMSDFENPDFGCLENYCVILDDKKYSWIVNNESVSVSDFSCSRWWEVVEA